MAPSLKIGLIGCGHIGRMVHLQNLRRMPGVEVVALAEADAQSLEAARTLVPRAAAFADYRELLERPEVDGVIVCLPNALHAEAASAALRSGKHLYLEKPLALTLDEGRELLVAWRGSDRVAMIGFSYRFNPLHLEVRRQLRLGRLGELVGARSVFTTAPHVAPAWKQTRRTGGGVLLDLASHHADLVRFWFGLNVREVRATVESQRSEGDCATLDLRLEGGALVQSFFATGAVDDDRFEIYGRAGKLSLDRYKSRSVRITGAKPALLQHVADAWDRIPRTRFAWDKLLSPTREPSFGLALAHFVEAARNGRQASPNFEDGFHSLAVILAAEESARTGRPTPVSPLPE